ncbi:uncharacterized protein N7479_003463 [Penicillium vulpinum]|uniref:Uncharacterized protein n=1 Tax=Penicillium vulpinum TaxID=29845 RepID=A0A1V6RX30_9EURO|nr:uncharacterized protein N7479_003463 [Penicillium vulpinum]KAJ5963587.1 hypothetical protein N7479_003463 [Penicillium vulpinum]OQE06080.1 hypothetical protein PENVUL_c020G07302 [Penicillium vulpinum]
MDSQHLPQTSDEWSNLIPENVKGKTIHDADLASASKFAMDQFLLLRVLWKQYEDPRRIHDVLDMKGWVERASAMLNRYQSWSTYCDSFESERNIPEGTFAIARHYQLEVAKTENKVDPLAFYTPIARRTRNSYAQRGRNDLHLVTPIKVKVNFPDLSIRPKRMEANFDDIEDDEDEEDSKNDGDDPLTPFKPTSPMPQELANILYPPTKDEQIVNTALVVFLNALTIYFPLSMHWTLHRKSFTAAFENAEFQARTDGYLGDSQGNPSVLIEVKPVRRSRKLQVIQMQESAQMVAWIKCDDEKAQKAHKMRLHISQDRHEVFVTVAKYDKKYLEYLNNPRPSSDEDEDGDENKENLSFLTMHQFGPWNTLDRSHIRELGPILLAITLKADADSKAGWLDR